MDIIRDVPYLKPDVPQPVGKVLEEVLLREYGVQFINNRVAIPDHLHFVGTTSFAIPSVNTGAENGDKFVVDLRKTSTHKRMTLVAMVGIHVILSSRIGKDMCSQKHTTFDTNQLAPSIVMLAFRE